MNGHFIVCLPGPQSPLFQRNKGWTDQLHEGKARSIKDIAQTEGFNPRYIANVLQVSENGRRSRYRA